MGGRLPAGLEGPRAGGWDILRPDISECEESRDTHTWKKEITPGLRVVCLFESTRGVSPGPSLACPCACACVHVKRLDSNLCICRLSAPIPAPSAASSSWHRTSTNAASADGEAALRAHSRKMRSVTPLTLALWPGPPPDGRAPLYPCQVKWEHAAELLLHPRLSALPFYLPVLPQLSLLSSRCLGLTHEQRMTTVARGLLRMRPRTCLPIRSPHTRGWGDTWSLTAQRCAAKTVSFSQVCSSATFGTAATSGAIFSP